MEAEKVELTKQLSSFRSQNSSLLEEVDRVKKDQEDLLVLLADQDTHVKKYKDRLKSLGQMVFQQFLKDYFALISSTQFQFLALQKKVSEDEDEDHDLDDDSIIDEENAED